MAQLPADRTKLNAAVANQQPSIVASAQANREALIEAYDTIDKLYDFTSGLVAGNILQPYPFGLYRNAIINGNFDVWQRGTSFYNPISTKFLCDRFFVQHSIEGFPNITISRQGITPGDVLGSRYCMRIETDGPGSNLGNNSFYTIRQKIENGTRLLCGDGRKVTFSFWARSSIPGKKMAVNLKQNYGTGGSPTTEEELVGKVFDLTSTWTKFSVTFTTNTLASKTFGTNQDDTLILVLWIQWGTNFVSRFGGSAAESFGGAGYIEIAQVQLNAGDVALPFQPRHYTEEFALCRRYCQVYGYGVPGVCRETTAVTLFLPGVNMRVTPTVQLLKTSIQIYDGVTAYVSTNSTAIPGLRDDNGLAVRLDGFSGLTVGRPMVLDDGRVILLDAEL
jgi:hypothetical protein